MDSYYDDGGCCIVHPDSTDLILTGGRGPLTQTNWSFVVSYSRDGGKTWTRCNPTPASAGFCYALAVAPSQTNVIYAGGEVAGTGAVYISTDLGSSWSATATAPTDTVFSLDIDAADAAKVFAATPSGVFATTDAGATWDRLMGADLRAVLQYPGSPDTLVVGGTSGVFISTDGGGAWDPMDSGLEGSAVTALAFAERGDTYLIAGTVGGSCYAWQFDAGIAEQPQQPGGEAKARIVSRFDGVEVEYQLPASARVRATLHDALGRRVGTFDAGKQNAGTHRLGWHGNQEGRKLSAGAYFVLLNTGTEQARLKAVAR
jgi:photosystem II stability/assembly factor-like uncharacterized protein